MTSLYLKVVPRWHGIVSEMKHQVWKGDLCKWCVGHWRNTLLKTQHCQSISASKAPKFSDFAISNGCCGNILCLALCGKEHHHVASYSQQLSTCILTIFVLDCGRVPWPQHPPWSQVLVAVVLCWPGLSIFQHWESIQRVQLQQLICAKIAQFLGQSLQRVGYHLRNVVPWDSATLVSPLTRAGEPRRRAGRFAGAALTDARKAKERACPELLHNRRCRPVVLGIEVGGRWSEEAASFITSLARTKTRDSPAPLRHAATTSLISRWTAFLTHAAMTAFAASLFFEDPTHHHNLDGEPIPQRPPRTIPPDPTDPSRLPPHLPWFVNGLCLGLCTFGDWPV